jgi:voltage-gated potassium channel
MSTERNEEFKSSSYELFILALSILSLFNWVMYLLGIDDDLLFVFIVVDLLLSLIFLGDFTYRLFSAESKRHYFFRQYGWLDLLGSLPFPQVKIFRLSRVIRALQIMRQLGLRKMIREFIHNQAGTAMLTVIFLIILVLEFGSVAILAVERDATGANITTASDAIWWSVVTVSTVGYGDQFPVTIMGRLIAVVVILVGVGLFGVVTGFLANRFLPSDESDAEIMKLETINQENLRAVLEEIASLRAAQELAYKEIETKIEVLSAEVKESFK